MVACGSTSSMGSLDRRSAMPKHQAPCSWDTSGTLVWSSAPALRQQVSAAASPEAEDHMLVDSLMDHGEEMQVDSEGDWAMAGRQQQQQQQQQQHQQQQQLATSSVAGAAGPGQPGTDRQAQPLVPSSPAAAPSPQMPSLLQLVRPAAQAAATAGELSQLLLAWGVPVDHDLADQLRLRGHGWLRQQQDEERLRELLQACLECGPMASKGECWMVLSQLALGGAAAVQGS